MPVNTEMICPHCGAKGSVPTRHIRKKVGMSGGKIIFALLTFGFSLLVTGLARKDGMTRAECTACGNGWTF